MIHNQLKTFSCVCVCLYLCAYYDEKKLATWKMRWESKRNLFPIFFETNKESFLLLSPSSSSTSSPHVGCHHPFILFHRYDYNILETRTKNMHINRPSFLSILNTQDIRRIGSRTEILRTVGWKEGQIEEETEGDKNTTAYPDIQGKTVCKQTQQQHYPTDPFPHLMHKGIKRRVWEEQQKKYIWQHQQGFATLKI